MKFQTRFEARPSFVAFTYQTNYNRTEPPSPGDPITNVHLSVDGVEYSHRTEVKLKIPGHNVINPHSRYRVTIEEIDES